MQHSHSLLHCLFSLKMVYYHWLTCLFIIQLYKIVTCSYYFINLTKLPYLQSYLDSTPLYNNALFFILLFCMWFARKNSFQTYAQLSVEVIVQLEIFQRLELLFYATLDVLHFILHCCWIICGSFKFEFYGLYIPL